MFMHYNNYRRRFFLFSFICSFLCLLIACGSSGTTSGTPSAHATSTVGKGTTPALTSGGQTPSSAGNITRQGKSAD